MLSADGRRALAEEEAQAAGLGPLSLSFEITRRDDPGPGAPSLARPRYYRLRRPDGTTAEAGLPWGATLHAELARARGGDVQARVDIGRRLRAFLDALGWAAIEARIERARAGGRAVVLTLASEADELWRLPWSATEGRSDGVSLGARPGVTLRLARLGTRTRPRTRLVDEPERILVAWGALPRPLPYDAHIDAVAAAADDGGVPFDREADVLPAASLDGLAERLATASTARPFSVLHLVCHGAAVASASGDVFGLSLTASGAPGPVDGPRLAEVLAPFAQDLRLIVLAACDVGHPGGAATTVDSVATALHRVGFEAVVAADAPLRGDASVTFAAAFHRALLVELRSVEQAFAEARRQVLARHPDALAGHSLQLWGRPADGCDTRPITVRPYRGLLRFEAVHARLFHGRSVELAAAEEALVALDTAGSPPFLVLAGASGLGKSSLARARLMPILGERWSAARPAIVLPGAHPSAALDAELARVGCVGQGAPRCLLLVDQFEEIFGPADERRAGAPPAAEAFVRRLWDMAERGRAVVVCTVQVAFFGRCGEVTLADGRTLDAICADPRHSIMLSRLGGADRKVAAGARGDLRDIVELPARRVGLDFEPGLIDTILDDVRESRAGLPLLEFALDALWRGRAGRLLTHDGYRGVAEALSAHADAVVAAMSPAEAKAARRLLVQLVEPGPTADEAVAGGRRRVIRASLAPLDPEARAAFEAALSRLFAERLLVDGAGPAGPTVELAHEALIGSWETLRGWCADDWAIRVAVRDVDRLATDHLRDGTLLRGRQLARAEAEVERHGDRFTAPVLALVARSVEARWVRWASGVALVVVVVLITSSLAIYASSQKSRADAEKQTAIEERDAKEEARKEAVANEEDALRAKADAIEKTLQAQIARRRARSASALSLALELAEPAPARAVAALREVDPSDRSRGLAQLYVDLGARPIPRFEIEHGLRDASASTTAARASFSPDGHHIVLETEYGALIAQVDGRGRWLHVSMRGSPMDEQRRHSWTMAGDSLVVSRESGDTLLYHRFGQAHVETIARGDWPRGVVAVSPDGRWVAFTGSWYHEAPDERWIWSTAEKDVVRRYPRGFLAFDPGGRQVALDRAARMIRITPVLSDSGNGVLELPSGSLGDNDDGVRVAFDRAGRFLAAFDSRRVCIWALDTPRRMVREVTWTGRDHAGAVGVFSPDGDRLLLDRGLGGLDVIPLEGGDTERYRDWSRRARWTRDGRWLIVPDDEVRVWDVRAGPEASPRVLKRSLVSTGRFDVDHDGRRIAGPCPAGACVHTALRRSDGRPGEWVTMQTLPRMQGDKAYSTAEFSPDGRDLVTVSDRRTAVWTSAGAVGRTAVATPAEIHALGLDAAGRLVMLGDGRVYDTRLAALDVVREQPLQDVFGEVMALERLPDGRLLVVERRRVMLLSPDGMVIHRIGFGHICAVAVADGSIVFATKRRHRGRVRIRRWRIPAMGEPAPDPESIHTGADWLIRCGLALSPDGRDLYYVSGPTQVIRCPNEQPRTGEDVPCEGAAPALYRQSVSLTTTPKEGDFLIGLRNAGMWLQPHNGDEGHYLLRDGSPTHVAVSGDDRFVAARDGAMIHVIPRDAPQDRVRIEHPGGAIALNHDGSRLVVLGDDGRVWVYTLGRELEEAVMNETTACLTIDERVARLGDSPAEACEGARACAARFDHTPPDCPDAP